MRQQLGPVPVSTDLCCVFSDYLVLSICNTFSFHLPSPSPCAPVSVSYYQQPSFTPSSVYHALHRRQPSWLIVCLRSDWFFKAPLFPYQSLLPSPLQHGSSCVYHAQHCMLFSFLSLHHRFPLSCLPAEFFALVLPYTRTLLCWHILQLFILSYTHTS